MKKMKLTKYEHVLYSLCQELKEPFSSSDIAKKADINHTRACQYLGRLDAKNWLVRARITSEKIDGYACSIFLYGDATPENIELFREKREVYEKISSGRIKRLKTISDRKSLRNRKNIALEQSLNKSLEIIDGLLERDDEFILEEAEDFLATLYEATIVD